MVFVMVVVVVVVDHKVDNYFLTSCGRCWSHVVNSASLTGIFGIQIHNGHTHSTVVTIGFGSLVIVPSRLASIVQCVEMCWWWTVVEV